MTYDCVPTPVFGFASTVTPFTMSGVFAVSVSALAVIPARNAVLSPITPCEYVAVNPAHRVSPVQSIAGSISLGRTSKYQRRLEMTWDGVVSQASLKCFAHP